MLTRLGAIWGGCGAGVRELGGFGTGGGGGCPGVFAEIKELVMCLREQSGAGG